MQQTRVKAAVGRSREELYPLSSVRSPHIWPRSAGGLSGRPFGRIFPMNGVWLLELDPMSGGWLPRGDEGRGNTRRLAFPSLTAAIGYAERHGIDYRVVMPPRRPAPLNRAKRSPSALPRSWLARLARNGRNGETYHG